MKGFRIKKNAFFLTTMWERIGSILVTIFQFRGVQVPCDLGGWVARGDTFEVDGGSRFQFFLGEGLYDLRWVNCKSRNVFE